jgi:hypothetical protein
VLLTQKEVQAKVDFSAAQLDEEVLNWFNLVDPDLLDMNHVELCVVGQLRSKGYGFWLDEMSTKRAFMIHVRDEIEGIPSLEDVEGVSPKQQFLTNLWKKAINERRK